MELNTSWLGKCFCYVWNKLKIPMLFQLAMYTMFDTESDSAVRDL